MLKFLEFLKGYIESSFSSDSDFSNLNMTVNFALDYNPDLKFPQVNIYQLVAENNEAYEVFDNELVSFKGVQITWFAKTTKIAGKNYNAYFSAIKIGEKLEKIFTELKYGNINKNILTMSNVGSSLIQPYDNTNNLYWGVIRYNINLEKNYV
jgi:hypothetical protein